MDQRSGLKRTIDYLYPPIEPFDRRMIAFDHGHEVYLEQCGNPDGIPILVFHGGPGGGISPLMRRYFDPEGFRVVLFDQRGCGRSRPTAEVAHNTTWDLISDAENIRQLLGLEKLVLFGGSWGATLSLIYAITYPEHVRHLILRGVFLMTQPELDWFYGGGAGRFFPDLWQRFIAPIPENERHDLIGAYQKRLFSGNGGEEIRLGRIWSAWENALASIQNEGMFAEVPADYARAFARLENHYFVHKGFLPEEGWILKNRYKIEHLSADIIQGRYDMVCPPQSAWDLAQGWQKANLQMVGMAGHAMSEPAISEALVRALARLR